MTDRQPRVLLISETLFLEMVKAALDFPRLNIDFGEPDENGYYTPCIRRTDTGVPFEEAPIVYPVPA